jgi:hypothetical protein
MYNLGAVEVGVAVATVCYPSCNVVKANNQVLTSVDVSNPVTGSTTTAQSRTETGTQTITPHVTGAFGPISFRLQAPQASGTINNNAGGASALDKTGKTQPLSGAGVNNGTSKSVSGSGYMGGVSFNANGLVISADVGSFTDDKVADLGQKKPRQRDLMDARVDVPTGGGQKVMVGYAQLDDNVAISDTTAATWQAHTYTTTETTVRYYIPVGFGNIIPEYRATVLGGGMKDTTAGAKKDSLGKVIQKDANDNIIRVIFRAAF